jgi:DNA-binding beta-propeller fold protein YncE
MERRRRVGRDLSAAGVLALLALIGCADRERTQPATGAVESVQNNLTPGRPPYTLFESGPVRPLALSPDGSVLFAVNIPDGQLEIFDISQSGLTHRDSVPVGLEPVAVAARTNDEVWVVNHLSDSVSVVAVSAARRGRVVRTLLVGDEPRDIVFAGPARDRAFITTAHRGQNSPIDPQLRTPGVGRADVWVFQAGQLGAAMGGTPLNIITLFSDTPRALAVSADGTRVYAAAFLSGNQTTTVVDGSINPGGPLLGGLPNPTTNHAGESQPVTGLIVKFNGAHWVDEIGRSWDSAVRFSLPDKDVFVIDATLAIPAQLPGSAGFYVGVGTVVFNMIVNPANGKVYVSNTEAKNEDRFEGPGTFAGHTVRGRLHESRISVLNGPAISHRHLNKHINYAACCAPAPNSESEKSLAFPLGMAISANGTTLYVAAFGSSKVGIFDTAQLENNSFVPSAANQIEVSGGGPSGLVLDEGRGRLYVLTRFNNAVSIVDTGQRLELGQVPLHNPEPAAVKAGRRFLYDARGTSTHGDSACASCHVFGDVDSLAWDLGNPDEDTQPNPNPIAFVGAPDPNFKPMKGPMTTQSLRGMANHGPLHWRGDRSGGTGIWPDTAVGQAGNVQPDGGAFDEVAAFKKFNPAFQGLIGRDTLLSEAEMQAFTDFVMQNTYPPNPIRNLDNSLTADQAAGRNLFLTRPINLARSETGAVFGPVACTGCHTLDPGGNGQYGVARPGFFGTSGMSVSGEAAGQTFKIPHLRNIYTKVGMFGMGHDTQQIGGTPFMGDQIRGFGLAHDGAVSHLDQFIKATGFAPFFTETERGQVVEFVLAFDAELAPVVGQQMTLTAASGADANNRIGLLEMRAAAGECDLIAKADTGTARKGYLYLNNGSYQRDRAAESPVSSSALRVLASETGQEVTFTCAPPGSGQRMGIDRDQDGYLDGDELIAGTDPANALSHP